MLNVVLTVAGLVLAAGAVYLAVPSWSEGRRAKAGLSRIDDFRQARRVLREEYGEIVAAARAAHPEWAADPDLEVLTRPGWVFTRPLDLDAVTTTFVNQRDRAGAERAKAANPLVWPPAPDGEQLRCYSRAIAVHDAPGLWWDSDVYRLVGVETRADGLSLSYELGTYFDSYDTQEVLGYAAALRRLGRDAPDPKPRPDPFTYDWRCASTAVVTLTIVRTTGGPRFLMHLRDPAKVATGGGQYHVTPAGEFEPSNITPLGPGNDCDLWRNIKREYAEEFLGLDQEHDGRSGRIPDYDAGHPFAALNRAREDGSLRLYALGLGAHPVTYKTELMTVAVFDEATFGATLGGFDHQDSEGMKNELIDFSEANVAAYLANSNLNPFARSLLVLAQRHRDELLG